MSRSPEGTTGQRTARHGVRAAAAGLALLSAAACAPHSYDDPLDTRVPLPTMEQVTPPSQVNPKYIGAQVCRGAIYVPSEKTLFVLPISERKTIDTTFVPMNVAPRDDGNSHFDSGPSTAQLGDITWYDLKGNDLGQTAPVCIDGAGDTFMRIHTAQVLLKTPDGVAEIGLETPKFAGPPIHDDSEVNVTNPADAMHSCTFSNTYAVPDQITLQYDLAQIRAAANNPYAC